MKKGSRVQGFKGPSEKTRMKTIQEKLTTIWNDDRLSDFSNPFCSFLYTLSLPYSAVVRLRNSLYDARLFEAKRLPCPVVSVGNLTVGGTGKTPMVILIANLLLKKGRRPAVLSRGYAGKGESAILVVSDGQRILAGPGESGDEPFLIALSASGAPVLTGRDRYAAGKHALENLGADTLVLDDAFQHRQVFRDINMLLLDSERPFGNGCLLPRGTLREPGGALRRADMIVLTRANEKTSSELKKTIERKRPDVPVFQAGHRPAGIMPLFTLHAHLPSPPPIKDLEGRRVFAFAGIARPESFRRSIESLGGEVAAFRAYPDHHPYSEKDVEDILTTSRERGADIILTTEKDGVKLSGLGSAVSGICMLRIEMEILSDKERFEDIVLAGMRP